MEGLDDPANRSDSRSARQVGHNVIVGSLALRAFRAAPLLLTPASKLLQLDGACHAAKVIISTHVPLAGDTTGRAPLQVLFLARRVGLGSAGCVSIRARRDPCPR